MTTTQTQKKTLVVLGYLQRSVVGDDDGADVNEEEVGDDDDGGGGGVGGVGWTKTHYGCAQRKELVQMVGMYFDFDGDDEMMRMRMLTM